MFRVASCLLCLTDSRTSSNLKHIKNMPERAMANPSGCKGDLGSITTASKNVPSFVQNVVGKKNGTEVMIVGTCPSHGVLG